MGERDMRKVFRIPAQPLAQAAPRHLVVEAIPAAGDRRRLRRSVEDDERKSGSTRALTLW
jgi:hypothetical protein